MPPPGTPVPIHVVVGEIEQGTVTTRTVVPTATQPVWPPFRRVVEGIASRGRHLPRHAHLREEVMTYVVEGFASYQLEDRPEERLAQGAARLLTAGARAHHQVAPGQGGSIRWFNLVLDLPRPLDDPPRLQATGPEAPRSTVDNVEVRPLTGSRGPMVPASGLESEAWFFPQDSTTVRKVGSDRRAVVYALAGHGSVDGRAVETGEAALADGVAGLSVRGAEGFRAVFATAPRPSTVAPLP